MDVRYRALINGETFVHENRCWFRRRSDLMSAIWASDLWSERIDQIKSDMIEERGYVDQSDLRTKIIQAKNDFINNELIVQKINVE